MQVLTVLDITSTCTILSRPTAQENGVLKFPDLREEDNTYHAVLGSGAKCAVMQYVEVCDLPAGAQKTNYIF